MPLIKIKVSCSISGDLSVWIDGFHGAIEETLLALHTQISPDTWKLYDVIAFRSQDAQCSRKVFFFDQNIVCIISGYCKDADLMFGKNPG